eukprot:TRINITY_DN45571_c0_g1_i2.p1 TRINITY_DN45571_c0_g1~~TRINITY_DN45571_c0_g1_i2.p1  ORF type:complete len:251 (+),score=57.22 TRINITY_DN45571_c0_g1_i2:114-866(+)
MLRRPPRSTLSSSSAASDVYKRQTPDRFNVVDWPDGTPQARFQERLAKSIAEGLPSIQQQPLLQLLNKGMLLILLKDLEVEESIDEYPAAELLWYPPAGDPAVSMAAVASHLGRQNSHAQEGFSVEAQVVRADPPEGCSALRGPAEAWAGKAVVMDRGKCTFVTKMHTAQMAGARVAFVRNTVVGEGPLVMGSDPEHPDWEDGLEITAAMVGADHGDLLAANPESKIRLMIQAGSAAEDDLPVDGIVAAP